ncbi:uncharacterized protein LOC111868919 isoform X4 [Cryptotermes secundus]|uniref:uncharacterized protein LOC111868919 isoform X4 n=1 Tax=Cryptotermes secundus TaxID=105785 RepID=UPI001454C4D6|nr:uncharacterized protein LOC111868919 isoform X4 [Cryptotermes secundus]
MIELKLSTCKLSVFNHTILEFLSMEIADEQGLLVVNLENCVSSTAAEQVVNGDCVYAVAVASNTCRNEGETVIQIPVSVHCSEELQQPYAAVSQLVEEQLTLQGQHYSAVETQQYTQIEADEHLPCLNADGGTESSHQDADICSENQVSLALGLHQGHSDETDSSYYAEIYNYLASQAMPVGATESYKKILKKRARNYKIMEGVLYYGQKLPKRVITEKMQQREILKNIHIEEGTGVHLGLKKMYMGLNQFYFWKGLYVDVANFVRQCSQCSETAEVQTSGSGQSQQLEHTSKDDSDKDKNTRNGNTSKVWQKVELKLYGPYPKTVLGNEFIITLADPFSHWIVAHPVPGDNHASHIADFVYKTFCTFGFAKCSVIGVPQEILEIAQCKYKEYVSRLQDTLLTCGLMVPQLTSVCDTTVHNLLVFLHDNLSQCTWVGKLLDEFVETNPHAWDLELARFLFEYCTTPGRESSSPFTIMFGRSPVSYLEEDKENHNVIDEDKPAETLSKRRRLQSSILQCRHCEEVFTSKISFRIHQRKHTEEARRQGTLEGQEPLGPATEREKRLLKRTILKRRQRLFKHGNLDRRERLMTIANQKLHPSQESLPKDKWRAELQANTVAAVRKLLASTKEERRRRGRYHKYSAELQEEMARYAMEHGNLETVRHFSQRMGTTVSESTVRNIVKLYRAFTPGLKEEIGRFAARCGVEMACSHFTERLGQEVRRGLVRKFKKLFLSHHPDVEGKQASSNKDKGTNNGIVNAKQKNMYTNELKDEIGSYACHFGIPVAVEHFAQKLSFPPKESTVRKFRKLYLDKHRATQQVAMLQQQLQLTNTVSVQEAAGPSSTQTIDILHASLNILNNAQVSGPTTVVYNAHVQPTNQLIPASHTTSSLPLTFQPLNSGGAAASYQQQTPVIVNQSAVAFNQNPIPLQTFQQPQPIFSSYNNQEHLDNSTTVPVSHKSVVTSVPLTITQTQSHLSETSAQSLPHSSVPTITVAIASDSQQQFQPMSSHSTIVVPHQTHTNERSDLESQSILLSHEQNGATVVQQVVASSLPHPHLQHEQPQQSSLSHELINGTLTNPSSQHHSQVLVQQSSVIADSLLVEQQTAVPDHSQIVEHHNLEPTTFVHALHDGTATLPFDTSGSTLIADRDGTYSIATEINSDMSVTVEKESVLQTSHTPDIPITIQMQEAQTQHNTEDVIISIVPEEATKKLQIKKAPPLSGKVASCSKRERLQEQETKVIHVVKVDCGMEDDVDDPMSAEETPRKRNNSVRRFCSKKKAGSTVGQKRGNYTVYSPEVRAEMGKYAAEHGSQRACRHFRAILGHDVPESTIRGLRDKYLLKREHCGSSSGGDKEVTSLGYAPRGRPMRLDKNEDE